MRKSLSIALICLTVLSATAGAQTRRRTTPKRSSRPATKAAEKTSSELLAGRVRVASQIKTLTQFLYLFGGIVKGFESVELAARTEPASPAAIQQNERNKLRVKESIRNVRDGLDKLETDFRFQPALTRYYPRLAGVASAGERAETQAMANHFDEAGRLLLKVVDQLADTLAAMQ